MADMIDQKKRFIGAAIEAANRAEATALLIRCGFRVYRPEADIEGEDLVLRTPWRPEKPSGELIGAQLKGRPTVDWSRYGSRDLHMLFPSASYSPDKARDWFLVPHDEFYAWVEPRHSHTPKWGQHWSYSAISKELRAFLSKWHIEPLAEGQHEKFGLVGLPAIVAGDDRSL